MRELLSAIEERLDAPTARGLAGAVSRCIAEGTLAPGTKMPPIRTVARELALSPTTVSSAWSMLARSGALHSAGRRGTVVLDTSVSAGTRYRRALERPSPLSVDLASGVPDGDLLPRLGSVLQKVGTAGTPGSYLEDPVVPELAELLRADWPYEAPALLVVDGAMDGMDLVTRTVLRYGDTVAVEHPCFPPLVDLLEALGVEIVGVPVDAEGMEATALAEVLRRPLAAVLVQPRAQNPTGVTMTTRRASALAALLAGTRTLVLEDDSAHGISPAAAISLGRWVPEQTVHVRSYSKSFGPDLRLAAMSGPTALVHEVAMRRHLGQGWSSRLLQRILVGLLTDQDALAQVGTAREEYARRRGLLVRGLASHGIEVGGTEGINIWVPVEDEAAALLRLASQGIGVSAGRPFAVLPEERGFVRVTSGLVRDQHAGLAVRIAEAARVGHWRPRTR